MPSNDSRPKPEQVIDLLGHLPLFQGLPAEDLESIATHVDGARYDAGEMIVHEGNHGDRFYIVFRGAVEVLKERPDGRFEKLAVKRDGEAFGEMALLLGAPRSASVRALEPTQLLVLSRGEFDALLGGESLGVRLMRELAQALRAADLRLVTRDPTAGGTAAIQMQKSSGLSRRALLPRTRPEVDGYDLVTVAFPEAAPEGERALWDGFRYGDVPLLAVVDVKGTDLPSTYLLGVTRALLREVARREPDFGGLLPGLNEAVTESISESGDVIVEIGLIAVDAGGVRYSIAGEQPGLVVRDGGGVEELPPHGPALGIIPRFGYDTARVELDPGESLLVFSEADEALIQRVHDRVRELGEAGLADIEFELESAIREAVSEGRLEEAALVMLRRRS